MENTSSCSGCGAPRQAGLVACTFCDAPFGDAPSGVDCPRCHDDNLAERRRCASCGTPLFRQCSFCQTESSVRFHVCPSCQEPFEGAEARVEERAEDERRRQIAQVAMTGATAIGGALLGGAAASGGGLFGSLMGSLSNAMGLPGSLSSTSGSARRGLVQGMTRMVPGQVRGLGAQAPNRPLVQDFGGNAEKAAGGYGKGGKGSAYTKGGFGGKGGGGGFGGKSGGFGGKGGGGKGGGGFSGKGGGGKGGGFRK